MLRFRNVTPVGYLIRLFYTIFFLFWFFEPIGVSSIEAVEFFGLLDGERNNDWGVARGFLFFVLAAGNIAMWYESITLVGRDDAERDNPDQQENGPDPLIQRKFLIPLVLGVVGTALIYIPRLWVVE